MLSGHLKGLSHAQWLLFQCVFVFSCTRWDFLNIVSCHFNAKTQQVEILWSAWVDPHLLLYSLCSFLFNVFVFKIMCFPFIFQWTIRRNNERNVSLPMCSVIFMNQDHLTLGWNSLQFYKVQTFTYVGIWVFFLTTCQVQVQVGSVCPRSTEKDALLCFARWDRSSALFSSSCCGLSRYCFGWPKFYKWWSRKLFRAAHWDVNPQWDQRY